MATYQVINADGTKTVVTRARFEEICGAESHCHLISGKASTLYPYSNAGETPYKVVTESGRVCFFDESVFMLALESGRFYHLCDIDGDTLFPYSYDGTSYCIHNEDGTHEFFAKAVFRNLSSRKYHAYYAQGGFHVLVPLVDKHIVTSRPTAENTESQRRSRNNRCITPSGAVCRGKCTKCPRNSEAIGNAGRENCCLKDVCMDDCNECRHPREIKETIPFSALIASNKTSEDSDKEFTPADDSDFVGEYIDVQIKKLFAANIPFLLESLSDYEREIITSLYGLGGKKQLSARQFADKHGTNHTQVNRIHKKILERFKHRLNSIK